MLREIFRMNGKKAKELRKYAMHLHKASSSEQANNGLSSEQMLKLIEKDIKKRYKSAKKEGVQ
jgi:hypothetical protein